VEQRGRRRYYKAKRQEDQKTGREYWGNWERGGYSLGLGDGETGRQEQVLWNRKRGGDTPELRDRKIRRQEENIVEQRERRRYYRAKRQEDQKTGGEYCGTGREEEILQS
jgi:hypothetical protein